MMKPFKVGDQVWWNSEAGRVQGHITRVHSKDVEFKGDTHHARPEATRKLWRLRWVQVPTPEESRRAVPRP